FNPKIDSISPKTVSTNTEITVYGSSLKYYDNKLSNENPELYLNDKKIENIILYEPNRIIFHLPENANSGYLKAKRFNKISNSIYLNVIEQPTIKNISPESGRAGTIISINGNNFSNSPGKVFFNSTEAEIISWEETNIVCKAPSNIPSTYLYILVDGMKSNSVFFNYTDTPSIGDYQLSKVDVHSFDPSGYNFTDLLQNYGNLSFGFKLFKPNNPFTKSSCTITFDSQSLNIKEAIIKYTYFEVGQGPIVYCKTTDIVITARDISPQTYSENTIDYQIGPEYADRITITFQSKFEWENLKTGERGTNYDSGVNDPKKMSPFYFHFY
ncbi:MAG: IPT/TIG domain-containing protein, partial [Bacteroidota bacterium]